ncbi:MAG: hypothetical protein QN229_05995 [Desulfurococcaceae archaeon TW002]
MPEHDPGYWLRDHELVGLGNVEGVERLLSRIGIYRASNILRFVVGECDLCSLGRSEESALSVLLIRGYRTLDLVREVFQDKISLGRFHNAFRQYVKCADTLSGLTTYVLCPFCFSEKIARWGSAKGKKLFRCSSCGRYFTRIPTWEPSMQSFYIPEVVRTYMSHYSGGGRFSKVEKVSRLIARRKAVTYAEKVATLFRLEASKDVVRVSFLDLSTGRITLDLDISVPPKDSITSVAFYEYEYHFKPEEAVLVGRSALLDTPLNTSIGSNPRFTGRLRVFVNWVHELRDEKSILVLTFRIRRPLITTVSLAPENPSYEGPQES